MCEKYCGTGEALNICIGQKVQRSKSVLIHGDALIKFKGSSLDGGEASRNSPPSPSHGRNGNPDPAAKFGISPPPNPNPNPFPSRFNAFVDKLFVRMDGYGNVNKCDNG